MSWATRARGGGQGVQGAPSTGEALAIMVQGYDSRGLTELRDDAERVLKTNFPATTVSVDGFGRKESPWWKLW